MTATLPINQIAFAVIDLRRTEAWWREGLGFQPAGGNLAPVIGGLSALAHKLKKRTRTCWYMVGRNDWAQLQLLQYEAPIGKLMPDDYRPCDLGYSRCGVWVADFDAALRSLAAVGTQPLSPPAGKIGHRRACVRNPDGVFVELMEDDPLPAQTQQGRTAVPAAIRYATLSTPNLASSVRYLTEGLGLRASDIALHDAAHETLWGMNDAQCERQVLCSGSDHDSILLEVVQYHDPVGQPLPKDYCLSDQRIRSIGLGDPRNPAGMQALLKQAQKAGAQCTDNVLDLGSAAFASVIDPQGFAQELMWVQAGRAQKSFGFSPASACDYPAPDNRRVAASIHIAAPAKQVFAVLCDHRALTDWAGLGRVELDKPGNPDPAGRHVERVIHGAMGTLREQITEAIPNASTRYRIIEGGEPFVALWGEITLHPEESGTRVDWSIRFRSGIPCIGALLALVLGTKLKQVVAALKKKVEGGAVASDSQVPPS